VFVLVGTAGSGKTRLVFQKCPSLWIAPDPSLKWFDGYGGEEDVLLDDYRGGADDAFLLRVLDRYPLTVPIKGGFVVWKPTRIFITSNDEPPFGHFRISAAVLRRIRSTRRIDTQLDFDDDGLIDTFWNELIN